MHFAILEELENEMKQGFRTKFGPIWSCHFAEPTTKVTKPGQQDTPDSRIQHDA
jgi:hypothetical protein